MYRAFAGRLFVFLVFIGLFSCNSSTDNKGGMASNARSVPIEGYVVSPSAISSRIEATGTLVAFNETTLQPEVSGRVIELNIHEGEEVSKGTLLVKLFDEDLQSQMLKIRAQKELAVQTLQRLSDLLKVNGISQQEVDQAATQLKTIEAEEEIVRVQIGKTEIKAPFNGVLGLRSVSVGAYINPATVVCTIRSREEMKLDFAVPEKFGALIKQGMKVQFTLEGDTSHYNAVVLATEQSIERDTRNLKVRARVLDHSSRIIPGSFAEVNIPLEERHNALMVPTQAVIPQARNKVVIVSKGGKAVFSPIKTGVREAAMVEITEGIQPGDTIATTGILFLRPDMPLSFSKIN
ncbi:MAG: efflux RND transporter periplasmic adaptor subunit [Crocinitomicaceae bacterium]|nr:efflux RND transporter periplasmic adaptor subunit [Crocinitomicaceae bacterium]